MGRAAPFFLLDLAFFICVLEVVIPHVTARYALRPCLLFQVGVIGWGKL